MESFETDAWLTLDGKVALFHDLDKDIYFCKDNKINGKITKITQKCELTWSQLQEC